MLYQSYIHYTRLPRLLGQLGGNRERSGRERDELVCCGFAKLSLSETIAYSVYPV